MLTPRQLDLITPSQVRPADEDLPPMRRIMRLDTFPWMVNVIPPGVQGTVAVRHATVTVLAAALARLKGDPDGWTTPGPYAQLIIDNQLVMSDTQMERDTNTAVVHYAKGSVLVAGLGLGMILIPILAKLTVTDVTVVEMNPDVSALVLPALMAHLPQAHANKLAVVTASIDDLSPASFNEKFDTIYFDIWPDRSDTNFDHHARLKATWAPALRRKGWMAAWDEPKTRWWRPAGEPRRRSTRRRDRA